MNGYASEGRIGGSNLGREAAMTQLQGVTMKAPLAVHGAQETLDKAVAVLYGELDQLESRLQSVLTQVPETAGNAVNRERPPAYSVATKISASAETIAAAAGRIRNLTERLEV